MDFKKFDRTPHVPWSGKIGSEDKTTSASQFLDALNRGTLIVEEKIDGANLGVSFVGDALQLQSRGHILSGGDHLQFSPAWGYFYLISDKLREILGEDKILFGEWLYYIHHVRYDSLPGWFIAFDIYDRSKKVYLPRRTIQFIPKVSCLEWVREIPFDETIFRRGDEAITKYLYSLTETTPYSKTSKAEGLYFRIEDEERILARAKFVRKDFFPVDESQFVKRQQHSLNKLIGSS